MTDSVEINEKHDQKVLEDKALVLLHRGLMMIRSLAERKPEQAKELADAMHSIPHSLAGGDINLLKLYVSEAENVIAAINKPAVEKSRKIDRRKNLYIIVNNDDA